MIDADGELDLKDYVAVFRRRWRWVAGSVVLVVGLVAAFSLTREEVYEASSAVQILTDQNKSVFNVDNVELQRSALAELQFTSGSGFAADVEAAAGFPVDFEASVVLVDAKEDVEKAGVLRFTAEASTAERARAGADAAAAVYLENRLARSIETFELRRAAVEADLTVLRDERTGYVTQMEEAETLLALAVPGLEQLQRQLERDLLAAELAPQIERLNEEFGVLTLELDALDELLSILAEPDSTARVLKVAALPRDPVSPDVPRNVAIGVVVGIVLGLILAILRDLLDPRARDGADLARLVDIPVMATIGAIRSQRGAPGRVRRYRDLSIEESSGYQVLLNSLWLTNVDDPLQSIVFTSDRPSVGKTQTVVNLAQAEAARGTRVLVIDSDFVNPGVAARLDLEPAETGLADLLEGRVAIEDVVRATDVENLHIIDVHESASAGELLRSDRFEAILVDLYAHYDLILIDSPPTLSTADSRLVASQADAVVVVYDPALSRREELQRTIDLLRGARANLIGLVANRSRASHPVYLSVRAR